MVDVVKLRYAINFAIACEETGCDPMKLLRSVNIDERMLLDPELMIAEEQLWTLARDTAITTGKFDIGFDAGRVLNLETHGAMQLLFCRRTLSERLFAFCEMAKMEYSRADFFVRPVWNGLIFGRESIVGDREQVRQVELYVLNLMFEAIRSTLGPEWVPKKLNLQSDHHVDLEWLAGSPECKLRFGQRVTEIQIDRRDTVAGAVSTLDAVAVDRLLTTTQAVAALVLTYLCDPRLSLKFISRLFGLSERHLQRELQKEGSSFSQILSHQRTKAATEMLKDPGLPIFEVSKSLGYSNQAHFTRAFLRSAGMTPSDFRNFHLIK